MCLITLSRNTFLDKILKEFRMGQVKKWSLLVYPREVLS